LVTKYPDIEILINNLGIFEPKPFEEIPDEDWTRFFDVNVRKFANGRFPAFRFGHSRRAARVGDPSHTLRPCEFYTHGRGPRSLIETDRGPHSIFGNATDDEMVGRLPADGLWIDTGRLQFARF
jgi:NAD(P)-dependent dehydrogenase (short-subunit alcohol dehydrogenase family)